MGFDDLNDAGTGLTRVKRVINEAMHEINGLHDWAFTAASASGAAPLTVSDLHKVIDVTDSTNDTKLRHIDRAALTDFYPDLPTSGTPSVYWLDGLTTLRVYPLNTSVTISVRYHKYAADLSADGDEPLIPDRYRPVLIYRAAAKLHRYRENFEAAAALDGEAERLISQMREALIFRGSEADFQVVEAKDY